MRQDLSFQRDDPERAGVAELLAHHHGLMRAQSPAESCHVKTAHELTASGARIYSLTDADGTVLAIGALCPVAPGHLELKSMHVRATCRGGGIGQILLDRMMQVAGAARISLETGSGDDHTAARALYARAGFTPCAPFGAYGPDPLSVFMTRVP